MGRRRAGPKYRTALCPQPVGQPAGEGNLGTDNGEIDTVHVGRIGDRESADGEPLTLVEANLGEGVVGAPLSKYARFHTRICRPTGLTSDDCARVCAYAAERIGFDYDVKNIVDLMRFLMPMPVPQRWRRKLSAASQVASGIWLGDERGFEDRSCKPSTPSARKRSIHLPTVFMVVLN